MAMGTESLLAWLSRIKIFLFNTGADSIHGAVHRDLRICNSLWSNKGSRLSPKKKTAMPIIEKNTPVFFAQRTWLYFS